MTDWIPQTVVAVPVNANDIAAPRAPGSVSAGEEVEVPRSAQKLIDGLVNYFLRMSPPMNYDLAPNGIEIYTYLGEKGQPGWYVYYSATPGMLHLFTPVGPTVPPEEDDEAVMAYLDGLTATLPVPRVFEPIARYDMAITRELGLYISLPMPRTFSAAATSDALWLIDWILREIERQAQE